MGGREKELAVGAGGEFPAVLFGMGMGKEANLQGHSEPQLPLHCFVFVLRDYSLDENPFFLLHLSFHCDQSKIS